MPIEQGPRTLTRPRELREAHKILRSPAARVYLPTDAHEAGLFRTRTGGTDLLARITAATVEDLVKGGVLKLVRTTAKGRLYRAVPLPDRIATPLTGRDRHAASWLAAERVFTPGPDRPRQTLTVNLGESPIGWLARRRTAGARPFLTRDHVAAGERLRADFERSHLGASVSQDWRSFLTAGVRGGQRASAQERDIDEGATAARRRLSDALDALGPDLADVVLRVCCYLEGLGAVEEAMGWSKRSGKVVLRIALQRLADFYEQRSTRSYAAVEAWRAEAS